jgi:hypothetical protein
MTMREHTRQEQSDIAFEHYENKDRVKPILTNEVVKKIKTMHEQFERQSSVVGG